MAKGQTSMRGSNVDPCLRALGGWSRYQLLQVLVINMGVWGAAFQLLDNIFIGRRVTVHQCAPPDKHSHVPDFLRDVNWNSSHVIYGECEITVYWGHHVDTFPCLFGHKYDYRKELSFRTEFDLVCGRSLLGDLLQTLVIMGQGFGAVFASFLADRYGRKVVLVWSQFGLLVVGITIAAAPSYTLMALLKFCAGWLQQGVMTGKSTMSVELFPSEYRAVTSLVMGVMWMMGSCLMAVTSYLVQDYSWRFLQVMLSSVSLVAFVQMWYLDESLRWLVANRKQERAVTVVKRAARVNRKDADFVVKTLLSGDGDREHNEKQKEKDEDWELLDPAEHKDVSTLTDVYRPAKGKHDAESQKTHKISIFDICRHRRLFQVTVVVWAAWFTCALSVFTLYIMSTSLHGNRFLNFFLTASMQLPSTILFYTMVDRAGRKPAVRLFFFLAGCGLTCSAVCRVFEDNPFFAVMSVATAMLGMMGAKGIFGALFLYTPELYPTNIRQQALGVASCIGRIGGMIGPFMLPLSEIIVWAPGAFAGSLCLAVIFFFRFLPETKGRELPQTLEDWDSWNSSSQTSFRLELVFLSHKISMCFRTCVRFCHSAFSSVVSFLRSILTPSNWNYR